MKKLFFATLFVFGILYSVNCQVNPHAIGFRGGSGNYGSGVELSYQHGMGSDNRLELDLGLRLNTNSQHFIFSGIYHWIWNITSGLNWYVGPGAQLGFYQYSGINGNDSDITLAIGGQIGIEFDFNELGIPFLVSLDTRPMWGLNGGGNGLGYGGALGLRYTF